MAAKQIAFHEDARRALNAARMLWRAR